MSEPATTSALIEASQAVASYPVPSPIWSDTYGLSKTGSWTLGINNLRPTRDVFTEFGALQDELTDEDAKATLAEFFFHNPRFLMDILGGIKLFPMQELILKGWAANDCNLMVASRGLGKSFLIAVFVIYWALFNPKVRIIIASYSFRQSRAILELVAKLINDNGAERLRACFPNDMRTKTDEYILTAPNGSTIRCLPLGDGKKIRGARADVLAIDEAAFLPESIIHEILGPFLAAKGKIKEQRSIDERESRLIAEGKMTEEERTVLDDRKKIIFLSSACWQFEHLFKRYRIWTDQLLLNESNPNHTKLIQDFRKNGRSFFIARLGWEAAPKGLLDLETILQDKAQMSEAMFNREYGARFSSDSDGYFRASKMEACSIPDKQSPTLELVGEPGAEYVLGIDQNGSGSEDSDHFAMCLMKIVTRQTDGRKIGMVVHSYAVAGCGFSDHALYLLYILTRFNVVYISVDASQGSETEFLNFCNQLESFKSRGLEIRPIHGVDFNNTDVKEMLPEIKRGYNLTQRQILQRQRLSSEWQRPANEYLQACFDHTNIRFASKIAPNDGAATAAMAVDISMLYGHEHFKAKAKEEGSGMSISDYMCWQDFLVDLTKKECAMIQVKTNDLGNMSWGLPQALKRTSGVSRIRKDSYSALLIANWAVRMYVESQAVQVQVGPRDIPYALVG